MLFGMKNLYIIIFGNIISTFCFSTIYFCHKKRFIILQIKRTISKNELCYLKLKGETGERASDLTISTFCFSTSYFCHKKDLKFYKLKGQ